MSQWSDRWDASGVIANVAELGNLLSQASERPQLKTADVEALDRLRSVHKFAEAVLEIVDPYLTSQGSLDQINKNVLPCAQCVRNFVNDGNISHLINANAHSDQVLPQLALLPMVRSAEGVKGLRESVTSFRQSAGQLLRHLEEDVREISSSATASKQRVEELSREIAEQHRQVTQVASEFQGQFSQAQATRLNEAAETARQRDEEFDKAQAEREEAFQAFVDRWEETLKAELQARKEKLEETEKNIGVAQVSVQQSVQERLKTLDYTVTAFVSSTEERSQNLLDAIQHHKEQAERLLSVIGDMGVTSGYQKVANRAWKVAWFWHGVTIVSLAAIIVIAYEAFLPLVKGNFTWESFAGRVFVTITVAALAAYAAHQADKNSRIERDNRRIELDLASIGPYLAEMPEEKQEEFRMTLADRTFGREDSSRHSKDDKSPVSAVELLKSKELREFIRDIVVEAIKAAKP
jgi:23S rRNA pseudoU1915 N3-methylase RlmH